MCKGARCPLDSPSQTGYNTSAMFPVRSTIGLLFVSILLFTAERGVADDLDQQIAERTRQYQESLRQRAAEISPSFQAKVESQVQQTIAEGLERWTNDEIDLRIALPCVAEVRRVAPFVARHLPGLPDGPLTWRAGNCVAALVVTSVQLVLKSSAIPAANFVPVHSAVSPFRQSSERVSYFIQVVCTLVQRR